MKPLCRGIFLIPIIFLFSCEENMVRFNVPQPVDVKDDTEIRSRFIGNYYSASDSNWLVIEEQKVLLTDRKPGGFRIEDEETSNFKKKGQINIHTDSTVSVNIKIRTNLEGVELSSNFEERLCDLKKGDRARFFKGYYFLNTPVEEGNGYRVRILRLTTEGVLLCRIQSDSILHLLEKEDFVSKQIEEADEITLEKWTLNPSRKELKKLIELGLFSNVTPFERVKN